MRSILLSLLCASGAVLSSHAASMSWSVIETARDNGRRLATASVGSANAPVSADAMITCDSQQQFQEIVGFGGALTESVAWTLAQLPADRRAEVLRRYYDPADGIGYTLARTHINSCDFSLSMWSLAETPGDYDLLDFSLKPMRRWLMPLLHEARGIAGADRFKLLASPWSPPAWMKTNNRMDDGGALRWEYRPAWSNLFVRFVQAMRDEEKIPIWALTVQNEPEAHQTWESCLYTPEQERDFIKEHLGPALANAGLTDVHLLGWDHNRDRIEVRAAALLGDPECAKYLWGLGVHWYVGDDFTTASRIHAAHPDKRILFTEGTLERQPRLGVWESGERYAHQMIGDLRNWVCGWIDWNIALDMRGGPNHVGNFCDAPVLVDTKTQEIHYQISFYYIAHFSRYVRPGAHRIASNGGPAGLEHIAFRNPDGSAAFIVMNTGERPAAFTLAFDGTKMSAQIPSRAIQTYIGTPR